jgi:hypothetical protein
MLKPGQNIIWPKPTDHSISVTMMSRFMLNLHSAASAGIFSTSPTSDASSGVAFTSRVPENLSFVMNSYHTDVEMPRQSLQVDGDFIAGAAGPHDIEMERRNDP